MTSGSGGVNAQKYLPKRSLLKTFIRMPDKTRSVGLGFFKNTDKIDFRKTCQFETNLQRAVNGKWKAPKVAPLEGGISVNILVSTWILG